MLHRLLSPEPAVRRIRAAPSDCYADPTPARGADQARPPIRGGKRADARARPASRDISLRATPARLHSLSRARPTNSRTGGPDWSAAGLTREGRRLLTSTASPERRVGRLKPDVLIVDPRHPLVASSTPSTSACTTVAMSATGLAAATSTSWPPTCRVTPSQSAWPPTRRPRTTTQPPKRIPPGRSAPASVSSSSGSPNARPNACMLASAHDGRQTDRFVSEPGWNRRRPGGSRAMLKCLGANGQKYRERCRTRLHSD